MLLLLPLSFLTIFLYRYHISSNKDFFRALASSILLFELCLFAITNLLSIFSICNRIMVFICWEIVFFITILLYVRRFGLHFPQIHFSVKEKWNNYTAMDKIMLLAIGCLFLILLVGALFTVPYNYDSMTYHLARIGHWIDNKSVNHFITHIDRQNYSPVLAEYNLLHIMLLSKSDTFVNFLQYFSMIICSLYFYKCARMLNTSKSFSIFASFLFVTMPLTISQSITTQNDLFAAMWFVLFLYYLLHFILTDTITFSKEQCNWAIAAGMTVAFAFLTKTSVCASMIFFLPWLIIVRLFRHDKLLPLVKSALAAGAALLVLISETLIRTYLSCGRIMAPTASSDIMVATKNIRYILVNILKNFSMLITQHIYRPLNGFVYRIAIGAGAKLNVEVNNEAIAFHGFDFMHHMNMGDNMYSHDITPSAFAAYLALLCGFLFIILLIVSLIRKLLQKSSLGVDFWLRIGFAISCWLSFGFIMALLRWQPWGTRLMYPAFAITVLMSANIIDFLCVRLKQKWIVLVPLCILSVLLCINSITYNMAPAIANLQDGCSNRMERYFVLNNRYNEYRELLDTIEVLETSSANDSDILDVGVIISGDGYDYPLWILCRETYPNIRLRHVVDEGNYTETSYPTYILWIEKEALSKNDTIDYKGQTYNCEFVTEGRKMDALLIKSNE